MRLIHALLLLSFVTLVLAACKSVNTKQSESTKTSEASSVDVGRNFIETYLSGNFEQANNQLSKNDSSVFFLNQLEKEYNILSKQEQKKISTGSYTIYTITDTVIDKNSFTLMLYKDALDTLRKTLRICTNPTTPISLTF